MPKLVRWIQNYLIYSLPFVVGCMFWETLQSEHEILQGASLLTRVLWESLAWNLMFWFGALILFLVLIVIDPEAREKTLRRLANLKERDEREQMITGKAARRYFKMLWTERL